MGLRIVGMASLCFPSIFVSLLALYGLEWAGATNDEIGIQTAESIQQHCTVLRHKTTYKQENAPTDITALFNSIYDRINEDLDGVVAVQITYVGDVIHRVVGEHDVHATVTRRSESGDEKTECMVVPVEIKDTNECTLPEGHSMRHRCHPTARCFNTIGSYECTCPNAELCVPRSGLGLCSEVSSTMDCCAVDLDKRPHGCLDKTCETDCRRDFQCYTNQCEGKCVYPELCHSDRGKVTCRCKDGKVGNGRKCPGETPRIYKDANGSLLPRGLDASTVCGCQEPILDLCHDVTCGKHASCRVGEDNMPRCQCQTGFREVPDLGCVDDTAPSLVLNGPAHLKMKQCDKYVERGVQVLDANSENTDRNVGVSYSQPPGRCSPEVGTFTVNYTLNTEWTYPAVQYIVRSVTIEDVDECSLEPSSPQYKCPDCSPRCHRHARCENRVGTYTCTCPPCMKGDGFQAFVPKKSRTPVGFMDGTGCSDVCAPVITLEGDQTVKLEVAAHTYISGEKVPGRNLTEELRVFITSTNGSAFCEDGRPGARCAKVMDNNGTHQGVDVTHNLVISAPVKVSEDPPVWHVTYNAQDEAGNYATPVIRAVEIKEVSKEGYSSTCPKGVKTEVIMQECTPCKRCPECPKQQPLVPGDNGRRKFDCRDCPCGARGDCMARSECQPVVPQPNLGSCPSVDDTRVHLPFGMTSDHQLIMSVCVIIALAVVVIVVGLR